LCQAGSNRCNADGTAWSGCVGEVLPADESCATPFDEDCDGVAGDGLDCSGCSIGQTVACYSGPPETVDVGLCRAGTQSCGFSRVFGPCTGEVLPRPEACDFAGEDENCDGATTPAAWIGDFHSDVHDPEGLRQCSEV